MMSGNHTEYRYGIALTAVLGAAAALLFADGDLLLWFLAGALQAGAVIAVYATTDLTPRKRWGTSAAVLLAAVLLASSGLTGHPGLQVATGFLGGLLSFFLAVTLLRAIAIQPVVDARTILGAITVYVLIGLLFSELYWIAAAGSGPDFFTGMDEFGIGDVVYFSYITLSTVGYGDLSPGTSLARGLAIFEAMLGQLYLVTVLALIVGNLGVRRERS